MILADPELIESGELKPSVGPDPACAKSVRGSCINNTPASDFRAQSLHCVIFAGMVLFAAGPVFTGVFLCLTQAERHKGQKAYLAKSAESTIAAGKPGIMGSSIYRLRVVSHDFAVVDGWEPAAYRDYYVESRDAAEQGFVYGTAHDSGFLQNVGAIPVDLQREDSGIVQIDFALHAGAQVANPGNG